MSKIDEIARQFSDAVQGAFMRVYGTPRDIEYLKSIRPSWSEEGIAIGWHDPDPGVVLVLTEYGWVGDPYRHKDDHKMWEEAMELLKKAGWDNVSFESINAAVHIVYWRPPDRWQTILNKRIRERVK